jgi:DNA-directed RNA polymerase specialized sigma24 family protein
MTDPFLRAIAEGRLALSEADRGYIRRVDEKTGSLRKAAQVLGINRSTVSSRLDPAVLAKERMRVR